LKSALLNTQTVPPSNSSPAIPPSAPRGPGAPPPAPPPNLYPRSAIAISRSYNCLQTYLCPCCCARCRPFCRFSHICRGSAISSAVSAAIRSYSRDGLVKGSLVDVSMFPSMSRTSWRSYTLARAWAQNVFHGHLVTYSTTTMENFALHAQHAGSINHIHTINFNSSLVDALKEVRLVATIVVGGWITVTAIRALRGSFTRNDPRTT